MRIRRITTRFALMLVAAALAPMGAFGIWSFAWLQRESRQSAVAANLAVAAEEALGISRELANKTALLDALAGVLQAAESPAHQARILTDYAGRFPSFRELTVFDRNAAIVATSRSEGPRVSFPDASRQTGAGLSLSPVSLDEGMVPSAIISLPLPGEGIDARWLAADVALETLWQVVEDLRVGRSGHALLLDVDGRVIAHGAHRDRLSLMPGANLASHPLFGSSTPAWQEYVNDRDEEQLAVAAVVPTAGWLLVVEQPAKEAFAPVTQLRAQLIVTAAAAMLGMLAVGAVLARRAAAPLQALEQATQKLASGDFSIRVPVMSSDEVGRLGHAFNAMADRLVGLQDEIKRQERQVMFGRVVAGLFHDLNHPIQSIGNSAQLLLRAELDAESRTSVQQTLDRELGRLRHFMDDVLNVARPKPLDRKAVDINATVAEAVDACRIEAGRAEVALLCSSAADLPFVAGDRFALGRVLRNLLANAIQATAPGGHVSVTTRRAGDAVEMAVSDTGTGIAPDRLATLFEELTTTRGRGLGLGLATSRRLVEQLGGTIAVASEVGVGSTFTVRCAVCDERSDAQAAS